MSTSLTDAIITGLIASDLDFDDPVWACQRADLCSPGMTVTPFAGRTHPVPTYSTQAFQLAVYHSNLETALTRAETVYTTLNDAFGELDAKEAPWSLDGYVSRRTTITPPQYAGYLNPEKQHPALHQCTLTLTLFVRIADE